MAQEHLPAHSSAHPPHADEHVSGEVHEHPGWSVYWKIAVILTLLTAAEVSFYYMGWEDSRFYVPAMLFMSGIKFLLVVLFYMHLRYDHRLFKVLFTGPFLVAAVTIIALMLLFGQVGIRLGLGGD